MKFSNVNKPWISIKVVIIFWLASGLCVAQEYDGFQAVRMRIDSLQDQLIASKYLSGDEMGATYRLVAVEFAQIEQYDSALGWLDRAVRCTTDSFDLSRYHRGRATLLIFLERMDQAYDAIQRAQKLLPAPYDANERIHQQNLAGIVFTFTGRFEQAFDSRYRLLALASKASSDLGIFLAKANLGALYYKIGDSEKAIDYLTESVQLAKAKMDVTEARDHLPTTNLSLALSQAKQYSEAAHFVRPLWTTISSRSTGARMDAAYAMGVAYYGLKILDSANFFFRQSLDAAQRLDNKRFEGEGYLAIGQILLDQYLDDSARFYLDRAERICSVGGFQDVLLRVFECRHRVESNYGTLLGKLKYQQKYLRKMEDVFHLRLSTVLAGVRARDMEHQYRRSIRLNEEILLANELAERRMNVTKNVQATFIFCSMCLFLVLWRGYLLTLRQRGRLSATLISREYYLSQRIQLATQIIALGKEFVAQQEKPFSSVV